MNIVEFVFKAQKPLILNNNMEEKFDGRVLINTNVDFNDVLNTIYK